MLHNAPSLDLSSIVFFWKKSRKIDHVNWIDTELIWNLIFPYVLISVFLYLFINKTIEDKSESEALWSTLCFI